MEAVLRRLKLRKGEPQDTEARKRLQQDLFAFDQCVEHGFPYKPTALAYDPCLRLLAVGTKSGGLRIYGRPDVQFSGQHQEESSVSRVCFLPDQGRLITLCADSTLHLWQLNDDGEECSVLSEVASCTVAEGSKVKVVSSLCLSKNSDRLYLGTDNGDVYTLDVLSFKLTNGVLKHETVVQAVDSEFHHHPGAIEAITQNPADADQILIGFFRGLIVLWNVTQNDVQHAYISLQQLECLTFSRDGREFISSHSDGSYIIWTTDEPNFPREPATTPYGPYPCKAITRMDWKTSSVGGAYMIFAGGMPRASYGDRFTVSVMHGDSHVVLDFTSKVVDFVTLGKSDDRMDINATDEPHSLLILAEEELIAVDLSSDGWPTFDVPYMCSLHNSAVTCMSHVTNVPDMLWTKFIDVGRQQVAACSQRDWPVKGGHTSTLDMHSKDLLITGHEDGSVRFWDVSGSCLRLLYKLETSSLFGIDTLPHCSSSSADLSDDWPPFRKVGMYDPFTEDPRLAIQKVCLCVVSETLMVAGSAGQVIVHQFERDEREPNINVAVVNIVRDSDSFVWRGHSALELRSGGRDSKLAPGFQPTCIVQLQPPATCTSAALHSEWQLFSVGTAYGFAVFDYAQRKAVLSRCTVMTAAVGGTGDRPTLSRRKSLQKSLRDSFRRLRRRRSEPARPRGDRTKDTATSDTPVTHTTGGVAGAGSVMETPPSVAMAQRSPATSATPSTPAVSLHAGDSSTDTTLSTVGCVYFADTFLLSGQAHTGTLWAATNAGVVYIYQLTVPTADKREEDIVQCILAKEIRLRHGAPVIMVEVIDRMGRPLPAPLEVEHERAKAPDMTGGHQVVVCSREQLKIFSLPSLKPVHKYKLCIASAADRHELIRLRAAAFASFRSRADESYVEDDLVCLLNTGEVCVFTVPSLRRQIIANVVGRDNVVGMNLRTFTRNGNGFFLYRPSEVSHFSMSARAIIHPLCGVIIKDGSRPPLPSSVNRAPASEPVVNGTNIIDVEPNTTSPQERVSSEQHNERVADTSRVEESAVASVHNESSLTAGDVTADSVQVHISEATSPQVVCAPVLVSTSWDKSALLSLKSDKGDGVFSLTTSETVGYK